jgi:hypothetical protein
MSKVFSTVVNGLTVSASVRVCSISEPLTLEYKHPQSNVFSMDCVRYGNPANMTAAMVASLYNRFNLKVNGKALAESNCPADVLAAYCAAGLMSANDLGNQIDSFGFDPNEPFVGNLCTQKAEKADQSATKEGLGNVFSSISAKVKGRLVKNTNNVGHNGENVPVSGVTPDTK